MYVEPFQDNAHFWHSIWVSCGKPINTEVHKIMKKTRNLYHYQIRRCRRIEEYIVNQKIIENCFEKDTDILEEVKKQRRHDDEEDITIDGVADENIPNRFAEVYQELFNREQDQAIIGDISLEIEANLRNANTEIDKINFRTIKEALGKIKSNKSDPVWDFSSDFLKEGPDILIYHLEVMIRSFLVHGHVSEILLLATLVPIVKDKLGDLCSSSNYRSIAISSIILKLLDWVIIINYGHLFKTDDFQFGFQEQSSTSMCSWVVYETIDSYIRKGSKVYGALMDCTKAFDTVQHSKLFMKLLDAGVPSIIVRLMIFLYKKQTADVRWKSKYSFEFNIRNGVRQGAVLSPILFCLYMDNLFKLLRDSKNGCWIGEYYAGVFGYADDLLLICPSRSGLQNMLGITERYANSHKISFSTNINPTKSKTKGIIFTNKETKADPEPLLLNGNPLPWVKSGKYLGNKLTGIQNGYQQDVKEKRARYIERNCELNQEFPFAHPSVKCHLNRLYNSSFYGSSLWDLTGDMTKQVVNSWSVSVRHMWDLPLSTHRNLIEPLSGTHAETMLLSRYAMFIQSLRKTSRVAVQFLLQVVSKDMKTVTVGPSGTIQCPIKFRCLLVFLSSNLCFSLIFSCDSISI